MRKIKKGEKQAKGPKTQIKKMRDQYEFKLLRDQAIGRKS